MKMIAELMPFNKAMDVARSNGYFTIPHRNQICGLTEDDAPWGEKIMVECNNLDEKYYTFHHYSIPSCCFEAAITPVDSSLVLRYGTIITDDQLYDTNNESAYCVRIVIINCCGYIYYIKIVNGKTVEFKKIGRAI